MIQFNWVGHRINQIPNARVLDVGAGIKALKKGLKPEVIYHSLDCEGEQTYKLNLEKRPLRVRLDYYNVIVLMDILEHCTEPDKVMEEMKVIAADNATFFIALPNEYSWVFRLYHLFGHITKMDTPFQIVTQHLHIHRPRVKDIKAFCEKHLNIQETEFMWYAESCPGWFNAIMNGMAKVLPSLFAKEVLIRGVMKE